MGIAIAHFKSPLQDVVRAAQQAEKRAKGPLLGRAAVAVTLLKRSGEISEWGAQWKSGGLDLYQAIAKALGDGSLSAKFPHRVCQLLEPYRNHAMVGGRMGDADGFDAAAIIKQEFAFAVARQSASGKSKTNAELLEPKLKAYLESLGSDAQTLLNAIDGLCTVVAFAHRTRNESADRQPS